MLNLNECYNLDCLVGLKKLEDNSADLIATDPPYFLINDSGNGFMGKEWDSISIEKGSELLLKSKEFVNFVVKSFLSMKVELNMEEENTAQQNVKIKLLNREKEKKSLSNASFVRKNMKDIHPKSNRDINSAQKIAITKDVLLGFLKESLQSHTDESQGYISLLENLSESVSFAVPVSYIVKNLTGIVQESALKFPSDNVCLGRRTHLTAMDEARRVGGIEGMIGSKLECPFTYETNLHVNTVESTVEEEKYSAIILNHTESHKTMNWIIWLLFVIYVIQKSSTDKRFYTKKDLGYALISLFNESWLKECLRVLKPGAFAFIMSAPRQDVLSRRIVNIENAGFKTDFSSIYWCFASGFPKSLNISKAIEKKLGEDASEVREFDGYYTFNPKPAVEIVLVAQKPLSEKTYVDQTLANGHGGVWLDKCRIPFQSEKDKESSRFGTQADMRNGACGTKRPYDGDVIATNVLSSETGRFPANLLVCDDVLNDGTMRRVVEVLCLLRAVDTQV